MFGFEEAIKRLKCGGRVAREGWNGKGMWLAYTPGTVIMANSSLNGCASVLARVEPESKRIRIGGHIDMRAADGSLVIGWLASQSDMLASDWHELAEDGTPTDEDLVGCEACGVRVPREIAVGGSSNGEDCDIYFCKDHAVDEDDVSAASEPKSAPVVRLYTRDGDYVASPTCLAEAMNPPPELVLWGERFFQRDPHDGSYREAFCIAAVDNRREPERVGSNIGPRF